MFLRNENGSKIGVFTRSERDHRSTVGDCSILLHNDFIKDECSVNNLSRVNYDVNDRLHEHFGAYSASFKPATTNESLLVHYTNPYTKKRYIYVVFEMICTDYPPPMFLKLRTRMEDAFIGMQDVKDVTIGLRKYNKTPIEVDTKIAGLIKPKWLLSNKNRSVLNVEIKSQLNAVNLTLLKVNVVGIG